MIRTRVDIVIPVLNESHVLAGSVARVREYLRTRFFYDWQIVIVDNGSIDGTSVVARELCDEFSDVRLMVLRQKGRGRALRQAWLQSDADAVCYMDVDLSTELPYLNLLIDAILKDGYDVATGSRLLPHSKTRRSLLREAVSRVYNLLVRAALGTKFSDAQCGFKAMSRAAVQAIVPQVRDESWFFDTEMLTLAEKQGLRIADIPVEWNEDDDSRVKILRTAWDDIKGIWRVRRTLRQVRPEVSALSAGRRP